MVILFGLLMYVFIYMILCNPMHPLYCALPRQYAPLFTTRGALVAHRYTYAPPIPAEPRPVPQDFYYPVTISVNDLGDLVIDGVGLAGFNSRANA